MHRSGEVEPIGGGGSGIVYRAVQDLHGLASADRAVKFFIYRDDIAEYTHHKHSGPISREDFVAEIGNITSFNHQSLIRVIDAGIYRVDGSDVPYIVTDFVNGPTLKDVINGADYFNAVDIRKKFSENPDLVIEFLISLAEAINHIHRRNFSHCDIAPKNVFISVDDGRISPVLGDLGISKPLSKKYHRKTVFIAGSRDWVPPCVAERLNQEVPYDEFVTFQPYWDIYSFSRTGIDFLSCIKNVESRSWYEALCACFMRGMTHGGYVGMDEIIERLEFLRPLNRRVANIPELSSGVGLGVIKMMPVEALKATKRIDALVRHPAIARLLDVPQLTASNQILPGASHTRYEHALGTIETMRRYLLSLLDEREFLEHLSAQKIEVALVCSALLSSTRFPISNVIHEIRDKHKDLFLGLSKRELIRRVFLEVNGDGQSLSSLISRDFPNVPIENVIRILSRGVEDFDDADHLIFSLLHSSLDVRVVDFVRRDAHHLGIISGDTFSLDDILPHVTVHEHRLSLKGTGVSVAEQILSLRYWLFGRAYWNRPNRSFCAMARHLLMRLHDCPDFVELLGESVLRFDQRHMLEFIYDSAKKTSSPELVDIAERLLGKKRIFGTIFEINRDDDPDFVKCLDRIEEMDYSEIDRLSIEISNAMVSKFSLFVEVSI